MKDLTKDFIPHLRTKTKFIYWLGLILFYIFMNYYLVLYELLCSTPFHLHPNLLKIRFDLRSIIIGLFKSTVKKEPF